MDNVRQYLISIIAMTILCGIVGLFFQDSAHKGIIKMITGLMVTAVVLKPAVGGNKFSLSHFWDSIPTDSAIAVQEGIDAAKQENSAYIKHATESYIISKAKEMGAQISVEVELERDSTMRPVGIRMIGNISPYMKGKLKDWIQTNLGIPEERQVWISKN